MRRSPFGHPEDRLQCKSTTSQTVYIAMRSITKRCTERSWFSLIKRKYATRYIGNSALKAALDLQSCEKAEKAPSLRNFTTRTTNNDLETVLAWDKFMLWSMHVKDQLLPLARRWDLYTAYREFRRKVLHAQYFMQSHSYVNRFIQGQSHECIHRVSYDVNVYTVTSYRCLWKYKHYHTYVQIAHYKSPSLPLHEPM